MKNASPIHTTMIPPYRLNGIGEAIRQPKLESRNRDQERAWKKVRTSLSRSLLEAVGSEIQQHRLWLCIMYVTTSMSVLCLDMYTMDNRKVKGWPLSAFFFLHLWQHAEKDLSNGKKSMLTLHVPENESTHRSIAVGGSQKQWEGKKWSCMVCNGQTMD